jgi:hypothetical protein
MAKHKHKKTGATPVNPAAAPTTPAPTPVGGGTATPTTGAPPPPAAAPIIQLSWSWAKYAWHKVKSFWQWIILALFFGSPFVLALIDELLRIGNGFTVFCAFILTFGLVATVLLAIPHIAIAIGVLAAVEGGLDPDALSEEKLRDLGFGAWRSIILFLAFWLVIPLTVVWVVHPVLDDLIPLLVFGLFAGILALASGKEGTTTIDIFLAITGGMAVFFITKNIEAVKDSAWLFGTVTGLAILFGKGLKEPFIWLSGLTFKKVVKLVLLGLVIYWAVSYFQPQWLVKLEAWRQGQAAEAEAQAKKAGVPVPSILSLPGFSDRKPVVIDYTLDTLEEKQVCGLTPGKYTVNVPGKTFSLKENGKTADGLNTRGGGTIPLEFKATTPLPEDGFFLAVLVNGEPHGRKTTIGEDGCAAIGLNIDQGQVLKYKISPEANPVKFKITLN